ncbi:MAG: O-methyltransferase [Mycoplasmoidaceae bacterium]
MKLDQVKKKSLEKNIPILRDHSAKFIRDFLISNKIDLLLEIGSGFGYSSLYFIDTIKNLQIDSIEKDLERYNFCINNIRNHQINFINICAYDFIPTKKYQCIFIDGPKSKQIVLFEKYQQYLMKNGYIIIDNIYLKALNQTKKASQKIIAKNLLFQDYLKNLSGWEINIIELDDGLAICQKKESENEDSC